MDLNLTLFGQLLTFIVFVWFTMKYVWPNILKAMQEREKRIADGLAAGARGEQELELAQHKVTEQMRDAKIHAAEILDQANKRASQIIEEAKERAREEGERILAMARADIEQEMQAAKQKLRHQVADLAIISAEKILGNSVDTASQRNLVEKMLTEI